jgi:cell wall-associated NlpC family hydrolase
MRMTSQPERPKVSRRRMLQAAAIVPAAAIPSLVVASPAHADYLGNISRSNVMSRAQDWFNRNIQYDGGGYASDNDGGHQYRRDCSGFVSMCWHTNCTSPDGGRSTATLPEICSVINWGQLKPGDMVNTNNNNDGVTNHCMLFHKWSTTPGEIWIYDLASPTLDMRHKTVKTADLRALNYVPLRYDKIFD